MKLYGYVDFIVHCNVSDPNDFFGFVVKSGGLWMIPPDDPYYKLCHESELAEIFHNFNDHVFSEPVLSFPCTREQLRDFLKKADLDFNVDPSSEILNEDGAHTVSDEFTIEELVDMSGRDRGHIIKLFKTGALKAKARTVDDDQMKDDPNYVRRLLSCVSDWRGNDVLRLNLETRPLGAIPEYLSPCNQQIVVTQDEWERYVQETLPKTITQRSESLAFPPEDDNQLDIQGQLVTDIHEAISTIHTDAPQAENQVAPFLTDEPAPSPAEYAKRRRAELKGETEITRQRFIASELKEKYPALQGGEIADIVGAGKYNENQSSARRKMGERRVKEGDRLRGKIEDSEIVTV